MSARTVWKSFRYRLEAWVCRGLVAGVPRLSRGACVNLANALGSLAAKVDRRGWRVDMENLACAMPHLSLQERARIVKASYLNFVRTMLDLFWGQNLRADTWKRWVRTTGVEEYLAEEAQRKTGTIFLCVHYGNWEWALLMAGLLDHPLMVVAENFKNPLLTDIFNRLREHTGCTVIAQEQSLLRMLRVVKRGGCTGMLVDLNLRPTQAATVVESFGRPGLEMCVPLLHSVLADRADAALVPFTAEHEADGTCHLRVHPRVPVAPGASLQEITQACWNAFEPIVKAQPERWLWPYKHFRYLPKEAARAYPSYAHRSGRYEKLRRTWAGMLGRTESPTAGN